MAVVTNNRLDSRSLVYENEALTVKQKYRQTINAMFGDYDNEETTLAEQQRQASSLRDKAKARLDALRDARPRRLTLRVATWLYDTTDVEGVSFTSRHGKDLALWAVFERPPDGAVSSCITDAQHHSFTGAEPEMMQVFRLLTLQWT